MNRGDAAFLSLRAVMEILSTRDGHLVGVKYPSCEGRG
jgi:hypothetical protein